MDEPSVQLNLDLRDAATSALGSRRPVLHHLNSDTSWVLQIPRPTTALKRGGRYYFNILIDPWLSGPQSDVAKWFSQQWHATESKIGSIAAVEELLRQSEILAGDIRPEGQKTFNGGETQEAASSGSFVDVVVISHEFTDHCHKETLLEVDKNVPVIATTKAAALIKSWKHFRQVLETPPFGPKELDWRVTSVAPLPDWLGISRLVSGGDAFYYHSAVMIAFDNGGVGRDSNRTANGNPTEKEGGPETAAEAIIYTPHGIHHESLAMIPQASPPLQTLAFLHGLHDVSIDWGQQLNLGAHNGLKAQRLLNARYWVATHDEVKKGGGMVGWFLRRKVISIGDALEKELAQKARERDGKGKKQKKNRKKDDSPAAVLESFEGTNWMEVANGESRILV